MKVDVPLDMKCKDKFLLQSTQITDGSTEANLGDLVTSHPPNNMDCVGIDKYWVVGTN